MKKKITALFLCVALAAIAIVGASLAYFTDTDNETNTFTVGGVKIDLIEKQSNEDHTGFVPYTGDKVLMPIVGSAQGEKYPNGQPKAANYIDKVVTIQNTGKSAAWIRAYYAVPSDLDDGYETFNAGANILHGNFGKSYINNTPITQELLGRLPRTLLLGVISIAIALLVGVPLGISAAVHQGSWMDNICMFIALVGVSMPTFWVALMLVILFALKLGWLPAMGIGGIQYYILPCIANSFGGIATQARQARSSMLEVIRSDYITTARAKGVSEHKVIYGHALPNALIPIVTVAGSNLAHMFGGSLIIEQVFSIPGIGTYMITAVNSRDYPVVEGCVIFLAITFSIMMLLVDLAYAYIDPRIKAQYEGGKGGH